MMQPQIPQGMEQMPSPDPTQIRPQGAGIDAPEIPQEEIEDHILESFNDLQGEDRELVAMYLTPETAKLMRVLFGDSFGNVFDKLADPAKILVPMDRSFVLGDDQGIESGAQPAPAINPQESETTPQPTMEPSSEDLSV